MARISGRVGAAPDGARVVDIPLDTEQVFYRIKGEKYLFELHALDVSAPASFSGQWISDVRLQLKPGTHLNPDYVEPLKVGDYVHMGTREEPKYEIVGERKGWFWLERKSDGVMLSAAKDTVRRAS